MTNHSKPMNSSKASPEHPSLRPPRTPDEALSSDMVHVREYIHYCLVRSSYKPNDLRLLLERLEKKSAADFDDALSKALAEIISSGPYRNNPVRGFVKHFRSKLGDAGINLLRESCINPALDRRLRVQCYQCLADLSIEGYTREGLRRLAHENAAIEAASKAAIRSAFVQAASEGYIHARLKGAGHEERCHLLSFVASCVDGSGIPSEIVRKGYGYGRFYSFDLVKKAANTLGVDWQQLAS